MTEYSDGSPVIYVGAEQGGLAMGDHGQLLTSAGYGAHVKWASGLRQGLITLVAIDDLAPSTQQVTAATPTSSDGLEDSLEVGVPGHLGLAHLCALRGPGAVLATIAQHHSAEFSSLAQEVQTFAEQRVSATASIQRVIAELDEEEGAELVRLAAQSVIRDTFGLTDA